MCLRNLQRTSSDGDCEKGGKDRSANSQERCGTCDGGKVKLR